MFDIDCSTLIVGPFREIARRVTCNKFKVIVSSKKCKNRNIF